MFEIERLLAQKVDRLEFSQIIQTKANKEDLLATQTLSEISMNKPPCDLCGLEKKGQIKLKSVKPSDSLMEILPSNEPLMTRIASLEQSVKHAFSSTNETKVNVEQIRL